MKTHKQNTLFLTSSILFLILISGYARSDEKKNLCFTLSFSARLSEEALDGRILLLLSTNENSEPRYQIGYEPDTQIVFGLDVEKLRPRENAVIDENVFGYPLKNIREIPPGEYWIQGFFNRYETFHRADGHIIKLPMDHGEGQAWNRKPGNFFSKPKKINICSDSDQVIEIIMDQEIPDIPAPKDTKYIKHIQFKSKLLSDFWGRPIYVGACVLLPEGFNEHPEARYPLIIDHGHFPYTFDGFRETPPDTKIKPEYSKRFDWMGYNIICQKYAYEFYKWWIAPNTPRVLIVKIQHANPYYDASYAVNSANLGPYGDAITYELIPFIENEFRGLGAGWARGLYGGSTGGWEALAAQIFYPNDYNGCYAACPDPIDFRAHCLVNIYSHENAYYTKGPFKKILRPGYRNYLGEITCSVEDMNHLELAIGSKGRSGMQWDIWQAVFSPVGNDGYPKPIWDKLTGEIDHDVADLWRENYDLRYILERDWKFLGPILKGKIHIYCGDMDNYYLNNAVYLMENFLESTKTPYYEGEVDYGDRAEHCWLGDHSRPNAVSRLCYHNIFITKIVENS